MINLGIYDTVKDLLEENGKSLSAVEETEPEPSLWKRWSWTSGCMFPGLYCYFRLKW